MCIFAFFHVFILLCVCLHLLLCACLSVCVSAFILSLKCMFLSVAVRTDASATGITTLIQISVCAVADMMVLSSSCCSVGGVSLSLYQTMLSFQNVLAVYVPLCHNKSHNSKFTTDFEPFFFPFFSL